MILRGRSARVRKASIKWLLEPVKRLDSLRITVWLSVYRLQERRAVPGVVRKSQMPRRAPMSSASFMVYRDISPRWYVSDLTASGT